MRTRETCVAVKEVRRAGLAWPLCHQSPSTSIARRLTGTSTNSAARNSRVLAFRQWTITVFLLRFRSTSLPPFAPRSLRASQLIWRLSHPSAFHMRSCGDPRFTTPESSCRSVSNHPVPSHVRFPHARFFSRSGVVSAGPFPVCAHRVLGFAISVAGSPRHKAESSF